MSSNGSPASEAEYALGIDLGTSGVRCCVIDGDGRRIAGSRMPGVETRRDRDGLVEQRPEAWWTQVIDGLLALPAEIRQRIGRIGVDGTSATLLLADARGNPLTPALMYNDRRATVEAALIADVAPGDNAAGAPSSSLAKLLWLTRHYDGDARHALHQADWITNRLAGRFGISDYNNALKLGYDPLRLRWPEWLERLPLKHALLPEVVAPGQPIGQIDPELAQRLGLSPNTIVTAGTTDSTAAFIATGAADDGDAVTSLGSTLVTKILSPKPIFAPEYGVYSHRLGDRWLVGGASNSGGAVLLQYFTRDELETLSCRIDPHRDSGLDFYPLPAAGERFPINDPELPPRLDRPADHPPERFLQGLFEGIARIERLAYQRLHELGAPWPRRILGSGGGAKNPVWRKIRERIVGCPIEDRSATEAACGAAVLGNRATIGDYAEHPRVS